MTVSDETLNSQVVDKFVQLARVHGECVIVIETVHLGIFVLGFKLPNNT